MKLDIYGRFRLEVQRENNSWVVYRLELGKRVRVTDLIIPNTLEASESQHFWTTSFMSYPDPGKALSYCRESNKANED